MSATIDPTTNQPLPADSIQRILHISPNVHVYAIPPLTSTKGYSASSWTHATNPTAKQIFTARLRIMETAVPNSKSASGEDVKTDLLLEDGKTGELFAAAPYTSPAAVEQANDSSRFFAIRVVGEEGRKATLGLGFEERSEAFDFGIALQEARKVLGMEGDAKEVGKGPGAATRGKGAAMREKAREAEKKDFSLKDGEMITISIGNKGRRGEKGQPVEGDEKESGALFSLQPPPPAGVGGGGMAMPFLPPPPSASDVKAERRRSRGLTPEKNKTPAQDLGFDDGEFGEFQ